MRKLFSSSFLFLLLVSSVAFAQQNVQGAAASGSAVAGKPILVGGSDGTNVRTISTDSNGRQVVIGATTPTDALLTPTTAVIVNAFPAVLTNLGTTWDNLREGFATGSIQPSAGSNGPYGDGQSNNSATDVLQGTSQNIFHMSFPWLFNGVTWDKTRSSGADSSALTGQMEVAAVNNFFEASASTTGTAVKATAGILHSVTINTGVANATIRILNLASAGCTGSPTSPTIALITVPATVANPFTLLYDVKASAGICIVASGATEETVSYQ